MSNDTEESQTCSLTCAATGQREGGAAKERQRGRETAEEKVAGPRSAHGQRGQARQRGRTTRKE